MSASDEAYKAIGLAVVNCQFLEFAFVVCVKLVFAQNQVDDLSEIEPLNKNTFKVPTKVLLNELRNHIDVSPEFETKLARAVDRRHELIHRWLLRHRWPEDHDAKGLMEVVEFANEVSTDVNALSRILIAAIHEWMKKFPMIAENLKPLGDDWLTILSEEYRTLGIEKT